jgi:hypothetical protein
MTAPDGQRPASRALIQALADVGAVQDPRTADDFLQLIRTTADVESEARVLLQDAVSSARSAGVTWSAIGATLGMSKQAAQKRFATHALPTSDVQDPNERILGPVTAFDELRELALAGQYGWHSVEFGPYYHRVVRSDTQWEHARVTMFRRKASTLQEQGWQVIGSEFPFTYLKRDLGTPALVEPST